MVMDEAGRNGENWHLAQQITYHVTIQKQQSTQPVIKPHIMQSYITIIITQIWGGFLFLL